ncbi:MAG: hypothetical protein ACI4Q3_03630 [Kiritimatiellia bacterium]
MRACRPFLLLGLSLAVGSAWSAYTPVAWIKASGAQWINTKYRPACTDRIELKVNFTRTDTTQALYCSRGSSVTADTFTSFLINGKIRVDRNNAAGGSVDLDIADGTDYVVTVDYDARTATVSDGTTTRTLEDLTDGAYTPGSQLALFVSQTTAGTLTDGVHSSQGNWGSYALHYVRIFDKDGALVRNFVPVTDAGSPEPRCTVGLYETVTRRFCPCNGSVDTPMTAGPATGEAAFEATGGDDEYVLTVDAGTTLALTAEHVAAAAGKTFVKAGKGSLTVDDDTMKDFPGDIRVREGYYVLQSTNALGTAAGQTYVEDGGTLVNDLANGANNGSAPCFGAETIHLRGDGCDGWGAVQNRKSCVDFCRNMVLDGPARVRTSSRFDWRYTAAEMNWHPLEVVCDGGGFYFVVMEFAHMGDITCTKGMLEFQSSIKGSLTTSTVTLRSGSNLSLWGVVTWLGCRFVLEPDVRLTSENGTFKYDGTDNRNILWSGDFVLQGATKNDLDKNMQYQFRGRLTGDGGIRGGKGGYLQLINDACNNDFKGGLDISGVLENGDPVGGVVVYRDGNIPADDGAAPLKLANASLQLRDRTSFQLPDVVASNRVVISNMSTVTACDARSLTKTGAGELTVFGPLGVAGKTEIGAGTLRLATRVPDCVPGLLWSYYNKNAGIASATDQGVDVTGVGYAYKSWPNGIEMGYSYTGYIRVPGEEGQDVTCNWMTSMARGCTVTIGGVVCCEFNDNRNVKDNITYSDWYRLAMYTPVTLKAGWQTITVKLSNWYDSTRGPQDNSARGWAANFGIGVDWQCRSVTNTANYAKLVDPGDGSFLRASLDVGERSKYLVDSRYRATFAGEVAFAPGAVFDIGDAEPYWPVTVPALTGKPTVMNGAVDVTSTTWTLRADDLASDVPLTVLSNAALTFGGAKAVVVDGDPDEIASLEKMGAGKALFRAENVDDYTFTLSPRLKEIHCRLSREGDTVWFVRSPGLQIIIR